jgi:hypothetical protein
MSDSGGLVSYTQATVGERRRWKPSDADRAVQKLHAIGIYDLEGLDEALGGGARMRPQTLNRRLRKAGFKVFGKEAIALLSLEIKNLVGVDGVEMAAERATDGSERVARAIMAGADGDTGVEVFSR